MKRREFLKTSAIVVAGTAAAASGLIGNTLADQSPKLTTLDQHEGETLLKVTRQIFPHKNIDDGPYMKVVQELDEAAKSDPATAKVLRDGVVQLDKAHNQKFVELTEVQQVETLKTVQEGPFFQQVHKVELSSFYSNPAVWKVLGYQGPAYKFGGYIHRGFDDLAWLPNPPEWASPKPS